MKKIINYILPLIVVLVAACNGNRNNTTESVSPVKIERIDRLAKEYAAGMVKSRIDDSVARRMELVIDVLNNGGAGYSDFEGYSKSKAVEIFQPDIEYRLGSLDSIEMALGVLSDGLKEKLPDACFNSVLGVVTPYRQSVMVADSVVMIGLNHYLGSDYPGYSSFDSYLRDRKRKEMIPVDVAEAVVAVNYPYVSGDDPTVLSRMLYEGALIHAILDLLPDASLQQILGYTADDMRMVSENEAQIWDAVVSRELLFSTDRADASRLFNPSPSTNVINPSLPGMVGRYIGYRIVESYLKNNPDKSIRFLLSPEFYNSSSSLVEARYETKRV